MGSMGGAAASPGREVFAVSARLGPGAFGVLEGGPPYSYLGGRTGPTCKRPMRGSRGAPTREPA